jgi:hypothetical protein
MNKLALIITALTTVLAVVNVYNRPRMYEIPNDSISYGYCNSSGGPVIFNISKVYSDGPMKVGAQVNLHFEGTYIKDAYLAKSKSTSKISFFSKTFETVIDRNVKAGEAITDVVPTSLKGAIKGKCKTTIKYYDAAGK